MPTDDFCVLAKPAEVPVAMQREDSMPIVEVSHKKRRPTSSTDKAPVTASNRFQI